MANKSHKLRHLIHVDPAAASKIILAAFREKRAHKGETAKALGCGHGTMLDWIEKLGIGDQIAALLEEARTKGWRFEQSPGEKGERMFEVVDARGERVGTYSTMERARERASQGRGLTARPKKLVSVKIVAVRPKKKRASRAA